MTPIFLPFEILHVGDLRPGDDVKRRGVHDRAHEHQITALECAGDDAGAVDRRDCHLPRKHRLRHSRRAGNVNKLGIETFFLIKSIFRTDPKRQKHRRHRRITDDERPGGHRASGRRQPESQSNGNELHSRVPINGFVKADLRRKCFLFYSTSLRVSR